MHSPSHYHRLRARFAPKQPSLILIAESPPVSGNYFYDASGRPSEPLFGAVMKSLLKMRPGTKEEGLTALCDAGVLLLDATYTPIDKGFSEREKLSVIGRDLPRLLKLLHEINRRKSAPLLLIKSTVFRALEPILVQEGYSIINQGIAVPFPSTGHQNCFAAIVHFLLRDAGFDK